MAQFNRIGIGGIPVGGASKSQRKAKYQTPCSEYTNILNQEQASNNAKVLNTDKALNVAIALNDYKPIGNISKQFCFNAIYYSLNLDFQSTDDILSILQNHPEIQRLPESQHHAILASIISAMVAGVGFALTIHLGGVGALAGTNFTISGVIKLAGATSLASGGSAGQRWKPYLWNFRASQWLMLELMLLFT